jgi:hypothetical protein
MSNETNTEFVERIMEFSPTGAVSQMFIMDAIVAKAKYWADDASYESWPSDHFITKEAWQATAKFMLTELTTRGYV